LHNQIAVGINGDQSIYKYVYVQ